MTKESVQLSIHTARSTEECSITLTTHGTWNNLLGSWPLPIEGTLDQLDRWINESVILDQIPLDSSPQISLEGCPSACLLPMIWLRTIWFAKYSPSYEIRWDRVEDPSLQTGRQPASGLACQLADRILCTDPDSAWRLYAIDPDNPTAAQERFDLLASLIDLWDCDLLKAVRADNWTEAMRRALITCSNLGHQRIGIYGGGTHTRAIGDALREPGPEIICIIDDDARRHNDSMWGFPIVSRAQAISLGVDAVVISANSIEDQLWNNATDFRERGIPVMRLYGQHEPSTM